MMKKFVSLLLALLLAAALPMSALADAVLEGSRTLENSATLVSGSNTYIIYKDRAYTLYDANGVKLTDSYSDLSALSGSNYLKAGSGNGYNCYGLVDAKTGELVLPMVYGDIDAVNADWVTAVVLVPTTDTESDYKSWSGDNRYNISYVDVVYRGKVVGQLNRDEYRNGYCNAFGQYCGLKIADKKALWFDAQGNRHVVEKDSVYVSSEYEDVYRKGVFHNPTGQQAFTSSCMLTADEVYRSVWYNDNGDFVDLQGNVINQGPSAYKEYDSVRYYGGSYMTIRANSKYGIVDMQGNEVLPAVYASLASSSDTRNYFASGYQAVLDDAGHLSFLDLEGNVTASVPYTLSESDYLGYNYNAPIIAVKNMGTYLIITASKGILPATYDDVSYVRSALQRIIAVKKGDVWGCIDMNGNTVVPFVHKYAPDVSKDGTLVVGALTEGGYAAYNIGYVTPEPVGPTLREGEWLCSCGEVNTTKFCPECGEAKPVEEIKCDSCGYMPEGAAPKFCPECGTKF